MTERIEDFESSYSAITSDEHTRPWFKKLPLTIEPVVFLFCVGATVTNPVIINLFLVHTCEISLGLNYTTCQELGDRTIDNKTLESAVQFHATRFTMGKSIIEACVPALLSIFIGPWSDLNGRKPLIMWPVIGYSISYSLFLMASLFHSIPPTVLMFLTLPAAFCGGFIAFISGIYSFISDVSKSHKTTQRMGILDATLFGGFFVGNLASSYIYNAAGSMGYVAIFATGAVCCLISFLYCLVFVNESVANVQSEYPCCCLSTKLFKFSFVSDMMKTCFEKRPNFKRAIILMMVISLATSVCTLDGESAVIFYFTREKFGFNLQDYTIFISASIISVIVGLFLGTYVITKWLNPSLAILGMIGYFCKVTAAVVCGLSPSYWYLYIGALISLPGASVGAWCRSIIANSVPKEQVGKVFSLLASLEALVPLAAPSIYTLLYDATITSFPGAIFFLSAGIFTLDFFLFLGVAILQDRSSSLYSYMDTEDDNVDDHNAENLQNDSIVN